MSIHRYGALGVCISFKLKLLHMPDLNEGHNVLLRHRPLPAYMCTRQSPLVGYPFVIHVLCVAVFEALSF